MEKSFRNGLLAAASALTMITIFSSTVQAADPVAEGPDWTGLYIGASVGGGAVVNEIGVPVFLDLELNGIGGEGALGSIMAGYNYQMNNIVFGLQGEVGYNNLSTELSLGGTDIIEAQQGLVASISARAGLLLTPETLAYIIGGYSYSEYETEISLGGPSESFDETYDGYHIGGGLETMIGQHATVRVEYRYTSYDGEDWGTGGFIDVAPSTHTGTLGLAWNFGGGESSAPSTSGYVASGKSDWTGLYIGASVGGGAVVNEIGVPVFLDLELNGIGGEGALGSIMAGYNYQMNNIVFGLQGEVGYNNLSTELSLGGTDIIEAQQGLVASISARAGLLLTPETLAYIIGGYSYSEYETEISLGGPSESFDETYDGYHIGGGLETMIGQHATVRVEYRYTSYDGEDWGTGGFIDVAPSTHTGTLGLAWNF